MEANGSPEGSMDLGLQQELVRTPNVSRQVRHLKWFRGSFHRCADLMTSHWGTSFDIKEPRLASAFLNWAEQFEQQRSYARLEPRDFAVFASGLLLQELLREAPAEVRATSGRKSFAPVQRFNAVADFWPGGFLATSYCISVLNAVAAQDFQDPFALTPAAEDLRTWRSFRENIRENPSCAVGFLDLFVGNDPNWEQPDWAPARPKMRRALARLSGDATARLH
jgi:hypothetical protein